MSAEVTNVIVAGLGGQGVLTCSDILAEAVFNAGLDVKKAEVHGMSQRGGSVACDVRFGDDVLSPMVPTGQGDFLVVLDDSQIDVVRHRLRENGVLIATEAIDVAKLKNKRSLNVAMLGRLSKHLPLAPELWEQAIRAILPPKLHEANLEAFTAGRADD